MVRKAGQQWCLSVLSRVMPGYDQQEFTEGLERRCGRRLQPLPVGRQPKSGGVESGQIGLGFGV